MSVAKQYCLGCDALGADGNDYLVVHIRDLPGLVSAPVVKKELGGYSGLASFGAAFGNAIAPATTSSLLYSGAAQAQIARALEDKGLSKYIDAHFTATPPPLNKPAPTEFVNGYIVGSVGASVTFGLIWLIKHLATRK